MGTISSSNQKLVCSWFLLSPSLELFILVWLYIYIQCPGFEWSLTGETAWYPFLMVINCWNLWNTDRNMLTCIYVNICTLPIQWINYPLDNPLLSSPAKFIAFFLKKKTFDGGTNLFINPKKAVKARFVESNLGYDIVLDASCTNFRSWHKFISFKEPISQSCI